MSGWGAGHARGGGWRAPAAGLAQGRWGIGRLTLFAHTGRSGVAAEVREEANAVVGRLPPATARRLSRPDRFALLAAAEACRTAGLGPDLGRDTGVYVGTTTGGMLVSEEAYRR